ncbi:MAG: hypothetical protein IJB67_02805 [Firmicutes bacterium]|nr:hypothetical protein [Bacillota bacterium]
MKIITINKDIAAALSALDDEFLFNKQGRPCLLIIRLKYRNRKMNFAVPFRSNIPPAEQKANYFPLPPRSTTKPKHRHGLHFTKMFPIDKQYTQKFNIAGNADYILFNSIISKNSQQIVKQAQTYLDNYANGTQTPYATNIDAMMDYLFHKEESNL